MCGIAGWISHTFFPPDILVQMTDALRHRGPDAQGHKHIGPVHFGHRRLSILDLAGSAQPMANADNSVVLTFNGEIYNFQRLREELSAKGHTFTTHGDTEVLLAAWCAWGPDMMSRLDGMFAFAIWDARQSLLFAARDRFGEKPFHYWFDGTTFVFASEIKALLVHPTVPRLISPNALSMYMEKQYIPAPYCIWEGVQKLPPGHTLSLQGTQLHVARYWQLSWEPKNHQKSETRMQDLDTVLSESVRSMCIADVPLGAFLSGGIDSSVITALMAKTQGRSLDTFTIGFEGSEGSEHLHAKAVADHLDCRHHVLMMQADDILQEIDLFQTHFDEPFGDQAALPTLALARYARSVVTVALSGEGADEVFAGYGTYRKCIRNAQWADCLAFPLSPLPAAGRLLPGSLRKKRLIQALTRPKAERFTSIPDQFHEELHKDIYFPAFFHVRTTTMRSIASQHAVECDALNPLDKLLHIDQHIWLPDDLLTKVDRAAMACSLEVRVPYLDRRVVEFAARLPPQDKLHGSTTKWILKQLARKYLPDSIIDRKKSGFTIPLREWLNGGLRSLTDDCLGSLGTRGILRPQAINRLLAEHRSGRRNNGFRLWTLLVLELWFRRHHGDFRFSNDSLPGTKRL